MTGLPEHAPSNRTGRTRLGEQGQAPALQAVFELAQEDITAFRAQLLAQTQESNAQLVADVGHHLFTGGGKHLRALLAMAAARLGGYEGQLHIRLATAIELIHSATLLHDDVIDQSPTRRGKSTSNQIWGNKPAVLVGDYFFARAFELLLEHMPSDHVLRLAQAAGRMAQGEIQQIDAEGSPDLALETYLQIIRNKTAALFEVACQTGGRLAGLTEEALQRLARYGEHLGMVFQMVDDVLDYQPEAKKLGKRWGDDFREKKVTLPILLAWHRADEKDKAFWRQCFQTPAPANEALLEDARQWLDRRGCLRDALGLAETHMHDAIQALTFFEPSPWREALQACARFALERKQ